jgi:hypothetical protein
MQGGKEAIEKEDEKKNIYYYNYSNIINLLFLYLHVIVYFLLLQICNWLLNF